ncbi:hypothetical protein NECAME_10440 [Necator americanus]|uniref:Uncharacterized protein n=1 Tax=Necator americanus TaxID=51031 RepID=W2T8I5_NECAM|nr:hypothetical protein NECAME_10440 [Necator americanus]ETN78305.1 hypothetical protein NECAME_10440 [Necator americanus]
MHEVSHLREWTITTKNGYKKKKKISEKLRMKWMYIGKEPSIDEIQQQRKKLFKMEEQSILRAYVG